MISSFGVLTINIFSDLLNKTCYLCLQSDKEQRSEITSPEPKLLGGAPMPIRAVAAVPPLPPPFFRREDSSAGTGLSLVSPATKAPISPVAASDNTSGRFCATMPPSGSGVNLHSQAQQQASRKARRCWSPELHRQFVAVLHQLGGPQGTYTHDRSFYNLYQLLGKVLTNSM